MAVQWITFSTVSPSSLPHSLQGHNPPWNRAAVRRPLQMRRSEANTRLLFSSRLARMRLAMTVCTRHWHSAGEKWRSSRKRKIPGHARVLLALSASLVRAWMSNSGVNGNGGARLSTTRRASIRAQIAESSAQSTVRGCKSASRSLGASLTRRQQARNTTERSAVRNRAATEVSEMLLGSSRKPRSRSDIKPWLGMACHGPCVKYCRMRRSRANACSGGLASWRRYPRTEKPKMW
jgi:hypothetical protein